jgi:hypothetical protein
MFVFRQSLLGLALPAGEISFQASRGKPYTCVDSFLWVLGESSFRVGGVTEVFSFMIVYAATLELTAARGSRWREMKLIPGGGRGNSCVLRPSGRGGAGGQQGHMQMRWCSSAGLAGRPRPGLPYSRKARVFTVIGYSAF